MLYAQVFKTRDGCAKRCRFENVYAPQYRFTAEEQSDGTWRMRRTLRAAAPPRASTEATDAGAQYVIPGCEKRTPPAKKQLGLDL